MGLMLVVYSLFGATHAARAWRHEPFSAGLNSLTPALGSPVQVAVEFAVAGEVEAGYFAVRVQIRNDTASELAWRARLTSSRWLGGVVTDNQMRMAQFDARSEELRVPAGASREFLVCLPVPGSPAGEFMITGPYVEERIFPMGTFDRVKARPIVLAGARPWVGELKSKASRAGVRGGQESWNEWNRERVPTDWRVLTAASALVLTPDDWAHLAPAQREAVRGYVVRGGHLDFAGPSSTLALPAEFGGGTAILEEKSRRYGLGQLSAGWFRAERSEGLGWQGVFDASGGHGFAPGASPDPLDHGLPRWTLFGVLILAAVLSGPVSLFWFARQGARHRLLILLPAIAVGATLVLIVVVTLREGFGGSGKRSVLLAAADGRPELAVFQYQTVRCGLLSNDTFTLPEDLMMHASSHPNTAVELNLQREGTTLSGDWFRNRTTTFHSLVTAVPSRAELRLLPSVAAGKPPRVVSTFAAPLRDLLLPQGDQVWFAPNVPPGVETTLESISRTQAMGRLQALLESPNSRLRETVEGFIKQDRYLARADPLEGVPVATLGSIDWEDEIYVTGRVTNPEGAAR